MADTTAESAAESVTDTEPAPAERVLFLASKLAYHTDDFKRAAERLGIELVLATDRCHVLAEIWPEGTLALDFLDPADAVAAVARHARDNPLRGVIATDETTAVIAGLVRFHLFPTPAPQSDGAQTVELAQRPVTAGDVPETLAGDKLRFRQTVSAAGCLQPAFVAVPAGSSVDDIRLAMDRAGIAYPVVIKPLHLSASRGVMRADDDRQMAERSARLTRLLRDPDIAHKRADVAGLMLIESFIPGREVAFEGLMQAGALHALAIFDKPEPLDGPYFAETIYVTPSRATPAEQRAIAEAVAQAARAIGLGEGPVHAELRLSADGPVVIELAARPIGGLCNRSLRFAGGTTLAELILAHAAGRALAETERAGGASGVYMLPVPAAGVVRAIAGVDAARGVTGVTDVAITARIGDRVLPLPEGNTYMGFIFAEAGEPDEVIASLTRAARAIDFDIARRL